MGMFISQITPALNNCIKGRRTTYGSSYYMSVLWKTSLSEYTKWHDKMRYLWKDD